MKRLSILLAAMILFAAAGCTTREEQQLLFEQKALENANSLYEAGDYEAALDAYLGIESYAMVAERIEQIQERLSTERAEEYVRAPGDGITYTWYYKDPGEDVWQKSLVTSATYSCRMTQEKDGRQIYCVIEDAQGNVITSGITTLTYED